MEMRVLADSKDAFAHMIEIAVESEEEMRLLVAELKTAGAGKLSRSVEPPLKLFIGNLSGVGRCPTEEEIKIRAAGFLNGYRKGLKEYYARNAADR